jgi:hypothetical protein
MNGFQYTVYYDYETEGNWIYNEKFIICIKKKGQHKIAEMKCESFIKKNITCDSYRILKVYCD